ncbi:MAG: glutamine--fructose-6-phosphate transaminase (isomerizing) [Actinobacteria bacterium]|nr:glutamine--fructose-6-phosphate transaminase (isomerizing) [Actinomycetota bacterium]MCA1721278.1 glutamine--fructose-6-phosphate transaminase (isomerizing) [Actinomycetota bacterium]
MCGIVGYVGSKPAMDVVLEGLRRLEYRGYDSAGVAVLSADGELQVERRAGKLANLEKVVGDAPLPGTLAIGHTRWATHGPPTDRNAHPHVDCSGKVAVVHNGTIENFEELVAGLQARGHERRSETDTEVVAHLLEERYDGDLAEAVRSVCRDLEGSFVLVVAHADRPDVVVGARRNLPLVIGLGNDENFLGSDVTAFIGHTREARVVDQDQVVELRREGVTVTTLDGTVVEGGSFHVDWDTDAAERGGYEFFMLKEIQEQPAAIRETLGGRLQEDGLLHLDELSMSDEDIRGIEQVVIIACGSSYHSGLVGKYAIERWCRLPVQVEMASEFRYRDPVVGRNTLVVAVSQSGETADTLEAVRHARSQKAWVLAVTNTVGSTISRESDAAFYTRGGPEVAVASTKAVITQIVAMYVVGLYLAQVRGTRDPDEVRAHLADLRETPDLVQEVLDRMDGVRALARDLVDEPRVLFLGRHVGYPMALEGALKLKELAYISAEGFPAGEIKHGPIALVEKGTPVVVLAARHALSAKLVNNVQEVRARGARTIVIATDGDESVTPYADEIIRIPDTKSLLTPLLTIVPMQVLSAEVARAKGLDVDQPRNLAKSVTVE